MALNFSTTSEQAHVHGVKMLVYARSGHGKTTLLASAPRPIILSAEAGLLSLSPQNIKRVYGKALDIPVILIETVEDLIDAHAWCEDPANGELFDTVALDSVTEIAEKVLTNAKTLVKDPRQAYGELIEKMTMVLKQFRDLAGKHVVFVAKEAKLGDDSATTHGPAMPGTKLAEQLPYLFDEVFHLGIGVTESGDKYRFLQTSPDLQFDAKDRSGALDAIEEPNLTKVITKIQSHVR